MIIINIKRDINKSLSTSGPCSPSLQTLEGMEIRGTLWSLQCMWSCSYAPRQYIKTCEISNKGCWNVQPPILLPTSLLSHMAFAMECLELTWIFEGSFSFSSIIFKRSLFKFHYPLMTSFLKMLNIIYGSRCTCTTAYFFCVISTGKQEKKDFSWEYQQNQWQPMDNNGWV